MLFGESTFYLDWNIGLYIDKIASILYQNGSNFEGYKQKYKSKILPFLEKVHIISTVFFFARKQHGMQEMSTGRSFLNLRL